MCVLYLDSLKGYWHEWTEIPLNLICIGQTVRRKEKKKETEQWKEHYSQQQEEDHSLPSQTKGMKANAKAISKQENTQTQKRRVKQLIN